jgi:hypothetical protein
MTAKHIIRVNGIDFDYDFIDFREQNEYSFYNVPTSKCFIYVWQKSNDYKEFEQNLKSLYDAYVAQHPHITASLYGIRTQMDKQMGYLSNYYKSRACAYRRKGVGLKKFPGKRAHYHKDWESLADFAESLCEQ